MQRRNWGLGLWLWIRPLTRYLTKLLSQKVGRLGHSLKTMGPKDFKPQDFEEQRANGTLGVGEAVMRTAVDG